MEQRADIAIVGAGILGLAHAYAAAKCGLRVVVFERSLRATGASVRNFGLIWPIGQPHGTMHQLALRSRAIWLEVLGDARLPYRPEGSFHLAYREDEAAVAREFSELAPALGYECEWLDAAAVLERSSAVRPEGLIGALWSPVELTVDPRLTLASLPAYLRERFGVEFRFGCAVQIIDLPLIEAGKERWMADQAIICSGDDFESLFPDVYSQSGLTRVKLQMLRTAPQPEGSWAARSAPRSTPRTASAPTRPRCRPWKAARPARRSAGVAITRPTTGPSFPAPITRGAACVAASIATRSTSTADPRSPAARRVATRTGPGPR